MVRWQAQTILALSVISLVSCSRMGLYRDLEDVGDPDADVLSDAFAPPDVDLPPAEELDFVLPFGGEEEVEEVDIVAILDNGDVVFNMDVTGSMGGAIDSLKSSIASAIIPELLGRIVDVGIGVSSFADYPCGSYGVGRDVPFRLLQRVTTDGDAAREAVDRLAMTNGGDEPESGVEALYQLGSGEGGSERRCSGGDMPAFDPEEDLEPGVAYGTLGGAGMRAHTSVRVVVHITDATSHAQGERRFPYGATRAEAMEALSAHDMRVMGIYLDYPDWPGSTSAVYDELIAFSQETDAVVDVCAWDGRRPVGCGESQCCTGIGGTGRSPVDGQCPLVFATSVDRPRVDTSVISGIEALLASSTFDMRATLRRDEEEFEATGIDTTCFINDVVPLVATPFGCANDPTAVDTDGDGVMDTFLGISPGSTVSFEVHVQNLCVEPTTEDQTYQAWVDLTSSDGTGLGAMLINIVVPGEDLPGDPDFDTGVIDAGPVDAG